ELPTGSRVAVRSIPALGSRRDTPVIFLHGGPGGYSATLAPTVAAVSRLSEDGFDVYIYDQVGGGLSSRLDNIAQYTLDRHLADLERVRARIGARKVILIGSSWGASLAANYMARYPSNVAAAVVSGAAPIHYRAWTDTGHGTLDDRMTPDARAGLASMIHTPRLFAALVLADLNPRAASRFAGDSELGALFDAVANRYYIPLAGCSMQGIDVQSSGYGFWSNRMTARSLAEARDDPRPALHKNKTPILVIRGACDYKKQAVAQEYVDVFPVAEYVLLEQAGHMVFWEQPDAYLNRVRAFLNHHLGPAAGSQTPPPSP
ncbi:MAG: alpha/beta fold hydrolase, partial [Pseudomonadota bacterium]